jgi:hypothetical protein
VGSATGAVVGNRQRNCWTNLVGVPIIEAASVCAAEKIGRELDQIDAPRDVKPLLHHRDRQGVRHSAFRQ